MRSFVACACVVAFGSRLLAGLEPATPFTDGAVLQRDREIPVWGRAEPGRLVSLSFAGVTVSAVADADGAWLVRLPPMKSSKEGRVMTFTVREQGESGRVVDSIVLRDVLVGEVWLCAGQSNAECPIWGGNPHYRDGQGATIVQMTVKPWVRLVKTPMSASLEPRHDHRARWLKMTPDLLKAGGRLPSAVGYLYALELANALDVPIGLVDCTWGGTNIDAWTPACGYEGLPTLDFERNWQTRDERSWTKEDVRGPINDWFQQPTLLWNGMVAAYAPMACRGFIWYQGCTNLGQSDRYCDKMHALYNGWSKEFRNPDLKLYFVQLAPFGSPGIPYLQAAQAQFDAEEKNAGMAVVNDVGNPFDIHPNDKRTVARRLALHALRRDYGCEWIADDSPTLKGWQVIGDKVVLRFNDADGWYLYNQDWSVETGFELCGPDGVWSKAEIENLFVREAKPYQSHGAIKGAELTVVAKGVASPRKLRYLFSKPWRGNLYNSVGLPLGAFRISDLTVCAAETERK